VRDLQVTNLVAATNYAILRLVVASANAGIAIHYRSAG